MERYAAFLRGINVGGINIKMADLAAAFRGLGFGGVRTVLASGNVLFEAGETDRAALKGRIEACLTETFGYEAWVVLLDLPALRRVVEGCPFADDREDRHAYAVLASDPAALEELLAVQNELDPAVERVQTGEGVLYWEVRRGATTDSVFGRRLARPRYKATTTTPNMRTLRKLVA